MQNVMVTGGAGFIGCNFIRHLLMHEPNIQVFNLDVLTYAGNMKNLEDVSSSERHVFIRGDICDRLLVEAILRRHTIDTVIHFAAESHVDRSILGPAQFIQTNVIGTFTLLEAARQVWQIEKRLSMDAVRFHHISTDEVFGSLDAGDEAFNEETPYAPTSPYSASKAASDHLARAYFHTYGLPVLITNCSNNYGPYQFPEKLIPLVILNAVTGKPLPIYGDGMQIRDWLFVEDHCVALHRVLRDGISGATYNIGGNNQSTNLEVVKTICAILDRRLPDSPYVPHENLIEFVSDRPGHDRMYAMDIRKIKAELGWQPAVSLIGGLEKTVKWYLEKADWIASMRERGEYQSWMNANYTQRGVTNA